ncbi:unnamed protein product [Peniophora sp. CBMAI 1063]|nr:unnamed protein product [Peniophora sp. CBMAI 1063]
MDPSLLDNLRASLRGPVYERGSSGFVPNTRLFNGNVVCNAEAVCLPLDAADVSAAVKFANAHNMAFSVKAGGYGTHGSAIAGTLVIDLSRIREIRIDAQHISLKNIPVSSENITTSTHGKRPREPSPPSALLPSPSAYDSASPAVTSFLQGAPMPPDNFGELPREPPVNRRRLDEPSQNQPPALPVVKEDGSDGEDPFGYMEDAPRPKPRIISPPRVLSAPAPVPGPSMPVAASSLPGPSTSTSASSSAPWHPPPAPVSAPSHDLLAPPSTPLHPHAYVSFGAGASQRDVDGYTASHTLAAADPPGARISYHVPFSAHPVGSGGMLLGGFGFLSRQYGLSVDNLIEAEVVLSDGSIVYASQYENSDLLWALRGAGPAFGVVVRYLARAYPIPSVYAGNLIWRFHRATAPSLLAHFRDCVKSAPPQLYANALLTAGPADQDSLVVIQMCYNGPAAEGKVFRDALASWDGEACVLMEVGEKVYTRQQESVAQVLRGRAGNQWFIRSVLARGLSDEVIGNTVRDFADTPIGCTWLFELAGGAIADPKREENAPGCFPAEARQALFTIAALHQWDMDIDDPRCVDTAENWLNNTLESVSLGHPLPSFLGRGEAPERVIKCYGSNWDRLFELKRKFDPEARIKHCFWPAHPDGTLRSPEEREPPTPDKPAKLASPSVPHRISLGKGKQRADLRVSSEGMSIQTRSRGTSGDSSNSSSSGSGSSGAGTTSTGVTTPNVGYPEDDRGEKARGLDHADVQPGPAPGQEMVDGDAVLNVGGELVEGGRK